MSSVLTLNGNVLTSSGDALLAPENCEVTITLYNPVSSSAFSSCTIKDVDSGQQLGTISSPTGSATITTKIPSVIRVELRGGYVAPPIYLDGVYMSAKIGVSYYVDGPQACMQFVVGGAGTIDIWGIDWDD